MNSVVMIEQLRLFRNENLSLNIFDTTEKRINVAFSCGVGVEFTRNVFRLFLYIGRPNNAYSLYIGHCQSELKMERLCCNCFVYRFKAATIISSCACRSADSISNSCCKVANSVSMRSS